MFQSVPRYALDENSCNITKSFSVMQYVSEVWNAPSQRSAVECATTLNDVLLAFQNCGSDQEVLQLANRIFEAIKKP